MAALMSSGVHRAVHLGKMEVEFASRRDADLQAGRLCFQGLNRMLTLIQAGHGIDVEIHAQAVTELIGHELGINARLSTETGMRTPHRLKGGPVESDGF